MKEWLIVIEDKIKSDYKDQSLNDISEKKAALDKFKLLDLDVSQHSEMVNIYIYEKVSINSNNIFLYLVIL